MALLVNENSNDLNFLRTYVTEDKNYITADEAMDRFGGETASPICEIASGLLAIGERAEHLEYRNIALRATDLSGPPLDSGILATQVTLPRLRKPGESDAAFSAGAGKPEESVTVFSVGAGKSEGSATVFSVGTGKSEGSATAFSAGKGKSEDDDGYCSRSSVDSPVQTSHSDTEANETETNALRDSNGLAAAAPSSSHQTTQRQHTRPAILRNVFSSQRDNNVAQILKKSSTENSGTRSISVATSSTVYAVPSSSSTIASSSLGPQRIMVVNKAANVRYLIPTTTTGTAVKSVSKALAAPPPAAPSSLPFPRASGDGSCCPVVASSKQNTKVPNLVNVKLLPVQNGSSLPPVPERENPGGIPPTVVPPPASGPTRSQKQTIAEEKHPTGVSCVVVEKSDNENDTDSAVLSTSNFCDEASSLIDTIEDDEETLTAPDAGDEAAGVVVTDTTIGTISSSSSSSNGLVLCAPRIANAVNARIVNGNVDVNVTGVGRGNPAGDVTGSQKILKACLSSMSTSVVLGGGHLVNGSSSHLANGSGGHLVNGSNGHLVNGSGGHLVNGGRAGLASRNSLYQIASRNNSSQDVTVFLLPKSNPNRFATPGETNYKQVVLRIGSSPGGQAGRTPVGTVTEHFKTSVSAGVVAIPNGASLEVQTPSKNGAAPTEPRFGSNPLLCSSRQQQLDKVVLPVQRSSSTNIGHFASLSLKDFSPPKLPGLRVGTVRLPQRTFQCVVGNGKGPSNASTASRSLDGKNAGRIAGNVPGANRAVRTSHSGGITKTYRAAAVGHLHPLVDHDYCEFATFCAEVQSSIISLTESSVRPERRYVKKNRAARTKALRVSQYASSDGYSASSDARPKRKYCKRKVHNAEADARKKGVGGRAGVTGKLKGAGRIMPVSSAKRVTTGGRDHVPTAPSSSSAEDKNYVKIPGYYQDEFVYYATKRLPGRPRGRMDAARKSGGSDVVVAAAKSTAVATGISVFDWYKEMAQTDKSSRFGALRDVELDTGEEEEADSGSGKDRTPVNESDVADLVIDMLPNGADDLSRPLSSDDVTKFMTSTAGFLDLSSAATPTISVNDNAAIIDVANTDLNQMAEEVRLMLSSMGEAELKLLESHLENVKVSEESEELHDDDGLYINPYLVDYAGAAAALSQASASSNLLDVDDINDGDLLSADIANMSVILNDLNATASNGGSIASGSASKSAPVDVVGPSCDDFVSSIGDLSFGFSPVANDGISAKPDVNRAPAPVPGGPAFPGDLSPPELTTINMFWNDLPGLLMNGREFVRLVDIHKQIMPAKDTGILKKRCHMMGLQIANCTELQRDFLVRYMNAAKSKSTVIVARDAAIMLIGFYVNPKSRGAKGLDEEEDDEEEEEEETTITTSAKGGSSVRSNSHVWHDRHDADLLSSKNSCLRRSPQVNDRVNEKTNRPTNAANDADAKRSERLKRKHVSYADMVNATAAAGGNEERDGRGNEDDAERGSGAAPARNSEQAELENLVREQKRRRLSLEEKLRLRLLRDHRRGRRPPPARPRRTGGRRVAKNARHLKTAVAKRNRRRLLSSWKQKNRTATVAANPGAFHTLEHCYAAMPPPTTSQPRKSAVPLPPLPPKQQRQPTRNHPENQNSDESTKTGREKTLTSLAPAEATRAATARVEPVSNAVVGVVHRDVACRVNRRRRSQSGQLFVGRYVAADSPCVRCAGCGASLTVVEFMRHMHWQRGSDKLVRITAPQKLHLQSSSRSSVGDLAAWAEFQRRRSRLEIEIDVVAATTTAAPKSGVVRRTISSAKKAPAGRAIVTSRSRNDSADDAVAKNDGETTRHSSRISKRKQLHPIERYIFAKTAQSPDDVGRDIVVGQPGSPDVKRRKVVATTSGETSSAAVSGRRLCASDGPSSSSLATPVPRSRLPRRPKATADVRGRVGRSRRLPDATSDRSLRTSTRRSHETA